MLPAVQRLARIGCLAACSCNLQGGQWGAGSKGRRMAAGAGEQGGSRQRYWVESGAVAQRAGQCLGFRHQAAALLWTPAPRTFSKSWPWVVKASWKAAASSALHPGPGPLMAAAPPLPTALPPGHGDAAAWAQPGPACLCRQGTAGREER